RRDARAGAGARGRAALGRWNSVPVRRPGHRERLPPRARRALRRLVPAREAVVSLTASVPPRAKSRLSAPFALFTGGKGAVGKSTLAANVALELARGGARTLLADLDLGLANLDVLLGLEPARTVEDALAGRCALADAVVAGPAGLAV